MLCNYVQVIEDRLCVHSKHSIHLQSAALRSKVCCVPAARIVNVKGCYSYQGDLEENDSSQMTKWNVTKLRENEVITEKKVHGGLHRSKPKVYAKWAPDIHCVLQEGWGRLELESVQYLPSFSCSTSTVKCLGEDQESFLPFSSKSFRVLVQGSDTALYSGILLSDVT